MNKAQAKFNNSTEKIYKAFFDLLDEYEFAQLNVKQIAKKAKINRSTFYAHYQSTYELLEDTQKVLLKEFLKKQTEQVSELSSNSYDDGNIIVLKHLLPCLTFIKENKKIFKIYIENLNLFKSDELFKEMLKNVFIFASKKHGISNQNIVTYIANYYLMGITSTIMCWLENDCVDNERLICEIIMLCITSKSSQ